MICWVLSVVFNGSGVFRFVWIDWPVTCFPACQWPVLGSWRGGKQPGRRSPGGWRSCGGRDRIFIKIKIVISSISTFSEHKGRLARSFGLCAYSGESKSQNLWFWYQFCNFSLSLSVVFHFCLFCRQCLTRIRVDWKYSPWINSKVKEAFALQLRTI